ncbi:tetratricopeptide repeat protein, partial [bacterium]|nr:tetratricopeptide repeat protein [bacterium]
QRDANRSQLNAAENDVQALRARLAASPVETEMKSLNQRIAGLEQEREAMAMALNQSRSAHTEALSRGAILEADLKVMQQKRADLDRDLKSERSVANAVVAGQRAQLQALEKELAEKNGELGKANQRIAGLIDELQESKDAFSQLRTERDSLLQERDQMSALLKLNEDGRIQDLIQQNMGLAKNLREANEKVERLNIDNNSAKDDIIDALRDLAIAKSQINKLHTERRDQDKRLADLEQRLKGEESALSGGKVAADPAEVAVLRDIIQRQLRVQERRRQARDLLIDAVKEMGTKDERIAQAINLFEGQEIQLSPDEQRLLDDTQVDGTFISPFAQDRVTVGKNTTELNRDIAVFERTAEKSFSAGRFLPTRELFQMIVEQHPGHIPALCKLGVVNLKLQDPAAAVDTFQRAVELDPNNPYAYRMLGYSLMTLGNLPAAVIQVERSVELAPADAKSQLLLAAIYYRLGRKAEAESHYKASITADPIPSEPYYNLAVLCSRSQRLDEARNYYSQALERGAVPDPPLEQRLAQP